jgi:hypothetical protein
MCRFRQSQFLPAIFFLADALHVSDDEILITL